MIQFDLSPVLHGAAAHLDEAHDRPASERTPAMEFTGSTGDPEMKHRVGYVEFED